MKPRPEFLGAAELCGAFLTGKPDGSEPISVVFTIDAWRKFDEHCARPVDMVLYCPACGVQHVDAPMTDAQYSECLRESPWWELGGAKPERWTNPPHRSHLCHGCGYIWRPADVPTNGVQAVQTKGKDDSAARFGPVQRNRNDAENWRMLRELLGYVENASDGVVKIFQDDATRDWFVIIGPAHQQHSFWDSSLTGALKKASGL